MNLPHFDLHPLRRRALINAGVATFIALVLGLTVQAAFGGDGGEVVAPPAPTVGPSPSVPACVPTWEIVQAADPGTFPHELHDVAAISAGEAWAVGASGDPTSPDEVLLERWDGSAWTAEEGPSPGSETNELLSVDAAEPNDVWAVGRTASGFGDRPLVLRYDGTRWDIVAMPPDLTGVLTGVEALAPNDVWAVGFSGDETASLNHALILHWDGELWATVDTGRAVGGGASLLNDVMALGPEDVWAVGTSHNQPLIIRFDGKTWVRTETPVKGVANAIEPVGVEDAWVVGRPIQRFDGQEWSQAANIRGDGQLHSISAVSPQDIWAVGIRPGGTGITRSLVLRFDGRRWQPVDGSTVPGSDALNAIDALLDGTVLGVGYKDVETGRRTLAIRGNTCRPAG